jgi:hypothetical protein
MRIGPFISLISSTFGVPETTVVVVARALREAGWLTSGARGVNAPDMTTRDAARLSLALLTGEPPGRVVEEFEFIRSLQSKDIYPDKGLISQRDLSDDHVLEDLLTSLFELHSDSNRVNEYGNEYAFGFIGPFFRFSVDASRRTAAVDLPGFSTEYVDISGEAEIEELYSTRSMTLDAWERIQELEGRSIASDGSRHVVSGRGMRVVRTITRDEIRIITLGLFDLAPE